MAKKKDGTASQEPWIKPVVNDVWLVFWSCSCSRNILSDIWAAVCLPFLDPHQRNYNEPLRINNFGHFPFKRGKLHSVRKNVCVYITQITSTDDIMKIKKKNWSLIVVWKCYNLWLLHRDFSKAYTIVCMCPTHCQITIPDNTSFILYVNMHLTAVFAESLKDGRLLFATSHIWKHGGCALLSSLHMHVK